MKQAYVKCLTKLRELRKILKSDIEKKKGKLYFLWLSEKTDKIENENDKLFIYNKIKDETLTNYNITMYLYKKANKKLQEVIDRNYKFDGKKYCFYNKEICQEDVKIIAKYILFKKGNVVWIDFGFNIGNEFGGMHPAVILKNFDSELFVLPVSSKKPQEYIKIEQEYIENKITIEECNDRKNKITEIVQLDKIYGFKNIERWSNITRMKKVSILRLNFSGSIGSVEGKCMDFISEKIKQEF